MNGRVIVVPLDDALALTCTSCGGQELFDDDAELMACLRFFVSLHLGCPSGSIVPSI